MFRFFLCSPLNLKTQSQDPVFIFKKHSSPFRLSWWLPRSCPEAWLLEEEEKGRKKYQLPRQT